MGDTKLTDDYTSFIKNGLSVGFTDDQIDYLWNYIGDKLYPDKSILNDVLNPPGKIEKHWANTPIVEGHNGDSPDECLICSLKNDWEKGAKVYVEKSIATLINQAFVLGHFRTFIPRVLQAQKEKIIFTIETHKLPISHGVTCQYQLGKLCDCGHLERVIHNNALDFILEKIKVF